MHKATCKTCAHYRQHYIFDQRKIFRVYCGHCTLQKAKRRQPDAIACEHYSPGQCDEDAFASKEYLSKVLLEYALSLELLPEICNAEPKQNADQEMRK